MKTRLDRECVFVWLGVLLYCAVIWCITGWAVVAVLARAVGWF